jgi:Rod binding domain-containing protein
MPGDLSIGGDGGMTQATDPAKRLRLAANQLEGMFIKMLFERVEAGSLAGDDPIFGKSPAEQQYKQLLHGALTERSAGSMGLADAIFHQLAVKAGLPTGLPAGTMPAAAAATPPEPQP